MGQATLATRRQARCQRRVASQNEDQRNAIDRMVCCSTAHAFALEYALRQTFDVVQEPVAAKRFRTARATLLDQIERFSVGSTTTELDRLGDQNAFEEAFAECVKMPPLAYAQILRLHQTRRSFQDKQRQHLDIRDIAAEEGFWEWGRFAKYYREQFGESPADTRRRI